MKVTKELHLFAVLMLLLSAAMFFAPAVDAVTITADAQTTIYALLIIDDGHPALHQGNDKNKTKIEGLLNTEVSDMLEKVGGKVNIDELLSWDDQVTKDNILNWIQNVNPSETDVVFVYFSGAGGADKEGAKDRYLYVQGLQRQEELYRKEIVKAIEALNCRLKILITDTGSTGPPAKPRGIRKLRRSIGVSTHAPLTQTDALRQLFLEHKGFLNLTATSLGHSALMNNDGGFFTNALIEGMLPADLSEVDRNLQDGFVSWEEVFELTEEYLNKHYKANESAFPKFLKEQLKKLNQTTQTPEVLSDFPKRVQ